MTADKKFKRLVRERARRTGESYTSARHALLRRRSEEPVTSEETTSGDPLVHVEVTGVRTEQHEGQEHHLVVLEDRQRDRQLPIFIGPSEAMAIAFALSHTETRRPLTHDVLKQTVDALGRILRLVIDFQPETNLFTADVVLGMTDGSERHLDWRVSDALALAVRCNPRPAILVPEALLALPPPNVAVVRALDAAIRLRCSCGAWMAVKEAEPVVEERHKAGYVDADVACPTCGLRQRVRVETSPARGGP